MPARTLIALLAAVLIVPSAAGAAALGRSFTYQGELSQSGTPVTGTVHLRFSLWDAATAGTQIGANQIVANAPIENGLFTVLVNAGDEFGPQAFNGQARWLRVEVCSDGSCGSATVLDPRQPMTAAPYALGPWQLNGTGLGYTQGNVGVGTASPAAKIHVQANVPSIILQDLASTSNQSGYLSYRNDVMAETGWVGYGTTGSPHFSVVNVRPSGDVILHTATGPAVIAKSSGNVGVGTSTPASKLEVRGDIRLGPSGEYFTPSGNENLRIIRGKVSAAGGISFGSGFTVVRNSTGVYSITFSTAFPSGQWPIITASAESNGSVARFAMINTPTHIAAVVRIVNGSGTAADADFYFIAIGPR